MNATADQSTVQAVSLTSKEGKAFLRKVCRDNDRLPSDECWSVWGREGHSADRRNYWELEYRRTIKQGIGEPELSVCVALYDAEVYYRGPHSSGVEDERTLSSGEKPVLVMRPNRFYMHRGDCAVFSDLLANGWKVEVQASRGSISSSEFGLSFYHVSMYRTPYCGVTVGGQTIAANGKRIVSGAVDW